jgi:hypothetical protein
VQKEAIYTRGKPKRAEKKEYEKGELVRKKRMNSSEKGRGRSEGRKKRKAYERGEGNKGRKLGG